MQENLTGKTTKCRLVKQRYTKGHKKEWNQHLQLNDERIKKRQKKLQSDYKLQTFAFDWIRKATINCIPTHFSKHTPKRL